jgi:hypothetical protein
MANLLQKASIVLTPTAYDDGKVLCAKPSEAPYGDFDFSRNSAATRVNAQGLVENVQILSSNLVQNGDFSEEGAEEVSNGSFSQEGVQLITNGDFATDSNWTKGTGWSISGGIANCDGTQTSPTNLIQANLALGTNKIFKIEFELKDYQAGKLVYVNLTGTGTLDFENVNANGTYVAYSGLSTGDNFITFRADADFIGSIDNVSVREVAQDWTLGTGWSIGEDKAVCDGTTSNLDQFNTSIIGKSYKVSVTVSDITTGALSVRLGSTSGSEVINITSNGTYVAYGVAETTYLRLRSQSGFDGSITNISVKEVGQNWSITGTGWNISDNGLSGLAAEENVTQPISTIVGKKYVIKFTISNWVSGDVYVRPNNSGGTQFYVNGNGTYTEEFTGVSNSLVIRARPSIPFTGTISNISLIEITTDTNLPRINYEGFSYQDALGSEQIVNGGFENNIDFWAQYLSLSTWDNGTIKTTSTSSVAWIRQNDILSSGKIYTITFKAKSTNISQNIKIWNGANFVDTNLSFDTVNEYKNFTYQLDFFGGGGQHIIIGQNSISIGDSINFDNVSVKEYLGQEVVPDSGCGSWLFEPQSTNLITYSEDFSDSSWVKTNTTISSTYKKIHLMQLI